jgi:hypothetical protein
MEMNEKEERTNLTRTVSKMVTHKKTLQRGKNSKRKGE